jgi:hypothetical protein
MSNREQNRQFDEAFRQLQMKFENKLTPEDKRRLHDEISGKGLETVDDIVQWGEALFL